ncbi:hypothetical protein [Gordonia westfalica]|uniref:Uncharacterized protein n=1 Tax=Gordonia westfalica TaxID=158898 RepID=A0A1H2L236_9ACTN|nr:hypothetical protein [Gordonia westfalica]SDU74979.1 hypothetical protein SAMN04488548_1344278 [Gordonia westfalica]
MAFFGDQKVASKISNPEVVAWAAEHPVEMAILQDLASQRLRRVKCRPSVTLAVLLQFRLIAAKRLASSAKDSTQAPGSSPAIPFSPCVTDSIVSAKAKSTSATVISLVTS